MAVLLDGHTQARAQMGFNVVCPRHNTEHKSGILKLAEFPFHYTDPI